MKKTITVNLNGRVFTIDEDAYRLLDNYLNNLRIYFRKEEGSAEIIADFEARIEELFSEKTSLGYQVITIEQVEEVIARVGKPDDFVDRDDTNTKEEKEEKSSNFTESKDGKKKFYRNIDDKMFGGICSGTAAYFGWDVLPVRIVFIILLFATSLWIVPFYLVAWIVFPGAYTAEQKLQMQGKPITVENIGKTVAAEKTTVAPAEHKGCLAGFIDLCVGLMKVVLIGLGCLVGLPLVFALVIVIIVLIAVLFGVGGGFPGVWPSMIFDHSILTTAAFLLVAGIPAVALVYAIIAHFAKLKPLHRSVSWVFLLIWIVALIFFLSSGFRFYRQGFWDDMHWKWSGISDYRAIRGNGIFLETKHDLEDPVTSVEMNKYLFANLQVEQTSSDTTRIVISGDENLVDQVKYDLHDGRLVLSSQQPLRSENNLIVRLQTGHLKEIQSNMLGNIQMNRPFTSDKLNIILMGPGNLQADSLDVGSLTVSSEGVGSVQLAGKAGQTHFDVAGVGGIKAFDLRSDTVYAYVKGIGSVQCNPSEYLEGRVEGIGKITYKEEPKVKNTSTAGIGKIGKE